MSNTDINKIKEKYIIDEKDLEILLEVNKEKFKRKLSLFRSVGSRSLAVLLILAIVWFGFINYSYASDIRKYRADYGDQWSCYICGYENLKSCSCIYQSELYMMSDSFNLTTYKEGLGAQNIQQCEARKSPRESINFSNFSDINLTTK